MAGPERVALLAGLLAGGLACGGGGAAGAGPGAAGHGGAGAGGAAGDDPAPVVTAEARAALAALRYDARPAARSTRATA